MSRSRPSLKRASSKPSAPCWSRETRALSSSPSKESTSSSSAVKKTCSKTDKTLWLWSRSSAASLTRLSSYSSSNIRRYTRRPSTSWRSTSFSKSKRTSWRCSTRREPLLQLVKIILQVRKAARSGQINLTTHKTTTTPSNSNLITTELVATVINE